MVTFRCAPGTVAPDPAPVGTVTLTDPAASFDTTTIGVVEVDDPPVANAGPDQTVDENTLVTLAGSGTDPEGETLTFNWTAPAGDHVDGCEHGQPDVHGAGCSGADDVYVDAGGL